MSEHVSGIVAEASLAAEVLRQALSQVPKLDAAAVDVALGGGEPLRLTSKQTNLVVAHVNRLLKAQGLAVITAKELIRRDLKPTQGGCLDPCEGATSVRLLALIGQRFSRAKSGA